MSEPVAPLPEDPAPTEEGDLKLIAEGLCLLVERHPGFLPALRRQLTRRSAEPQEPKREPPPHVEIKLALEAVLLPKYAGLDQSLWNARLAQLEAAYPVLVENIRQQVLWEARSSNELKPLVPLKKAIHLVLAETMKLSDHSNPNTVSVHSDDEKQAK